MQSADRSILPTFLGKVDHTLGTLGRGVFLGKLWTPVGYGNAPVLPRPTLYGSSGNQAFECFIVISVRNRPGTALDDPASTSLTLKTVKLRC